MEGCSLTVLWSESSETLPSSVETLSVWFAVNIVFFTFVNFSASILNKRITLFNPNHKRMNSSASLLKRAQTCIFGKPTLDHCGLQISSTQHKISLFFLSKFENINENYNQNVNFISDFKAVLMSIEYVRNKEAQRHKEHTSRNNKKNKSWHHLQPNHRFGKKLKKNGYITLWYFSLSFLIFLQNTKAQPSQHTLLIQYWQHFSQWFHCNSQPMHQPLWLTW